MSRFIEAYISPEAGKAFAGLFLIGFVVLPFSWVVTKRAWLLGVGFAVWTAIAVLIIVVLNALTPQTVKDMGDFALKTYQENVSLDLFLWKEKTDQEGERKKAKIRRERVKTNQETEKIEKIYFVMKNATLYNEDFSIYDYNFRERKFVEGVFDPKIPKAMIERNGREFRLINLPNFFSTLVEEKGVITEVWKEDPANGPSVYIKLQDLKTERPSPEKTKSKDKEEREKEKPASKSKLKPEIKTPSFWGNTVEIKMDSKAIQLTSPLIVSRKNDSTWGFKIEVTDGKIQIPGELTYFRGVKSPLKYKFTFPTGTILVLPHGVLNFEGLACPGSCSEKGSIVVSKFSYQKID